MGDDTAKTPARSPRNYKSFWLRLWKNCNQLWCHVASVAHSSAITSDRNPGFQNKTPSDAIYILKRNISFMTIFILQYNEGRENKINSLLNFIKSVLVDLLEKSEPFSLDGNGENTGLASLHRMQDTFYVPVRLLVVIYHTWYSTDLPSYMVLENYWLVIAHLNNIQKLGKLCRRKTFR